MGYIDNDEKQRLDLENICKGSYGDEDPGLEPPFTQDAGEPSFLGFLLLMHPMVKPSSSEEELFSAPPPSP
jgi:hypothetical protein